MVVKMLNVPGSMDFTNNKTMALNSKFCQNGRQYLVPLLFFLAVERSFQGVIRWIKVLFKCFCTGVVLLMVNVIWVLQGIYTGLEENNLEMDTSKWLNLFLVFVELRKSKWCELISSEWHQMVVLR